LKESAGNIFLLFADTSRLTNTLLIERRSLINQASRREVTL
jgi:hypothetical protein